MRTRKNNLQIRELTLKNGMSFPSDEELVMLVIGSGTKTVPVERLAGKILSVVLSSNPEELVGKLQLINGVGQNKALSMAAALELGRRMNRSPQGTIGEPRDVVPFIKGYAVQSQEHFICITLNGAREILSIRVVCVGTGNMAVIRPSDIFAEAMKERASAIIVSHNHPSGSLSPSDDDIKTTRRLVDASEILGIALLDHIIIARGGYFSFAEHSMLR